MNIYESLNTKELQAHEQFLARTVFPLIYETPDRVGVLGSGCFFRQSGSVYIVTAAHVLDGVNVASLGIPEQPMKDVLIRKIQDANVCKFENHILDVAILELKDELFVEEVVESWTVLDSSYCDGDSPITDGTEFLIAAHPTANVEEEADRLTPRSLFQLYTTFYPGTSDQDPTEYDILMKHSKKARAASGKIIDVVDMRGASGAPVWQLVASPDGIWSPTKSITLVGVQEAFKPGTYIKAKQWSLVCDLIERN